MKLIRVYYNETKISIVRRLLKSILNFILTKHSHSNHYCPGESGSGEWSSIPQDIPCRCFYCKAPNHKLKNERNKI